ncbi:hypothetical protein V7138_01430 [Bacillus sp. JJ1533]
MGYFERLKEIYQLQWGFLVDYWYVHIGMMLVGLGFVFVWVWRKKS